MGYKGTLDRDDRVLIMWVCPFVEATINRIVVTFEGRSGLGSVLERSANFGVTGHFIDLDINYHCIFICFVIIQ